MRYAVVVTAPAEEDLIKNARWWAEHRSKKQAERWYDGFLKSIESLGEAPHRLPIARENDKFPIEIRELHYGLGLHATHRAVFTIRPEIVLIYAIRHVAQADLTEEDLFQ